MLSNKVDYSLILVSILAPKEELFSYAVAIVVKLNFLKYAAFLCGQGVKFCQSNCIINLSLRSTA